MQDPRFTTNLDGDPFAGDPLPQGAIAEVTTPESRKADAARATLYDALTVLVVVGTLITLAVAVPVIVAAYRWAF